MMSSCAPEGWVAAGELILRAPTPTLPPGELIPDDYDGEVMIHPDGSRSLIDSPRATVHARRVRRYSLDPAPSGTPLLSRLRALHTWTSPGGLVPLSAEWRPVANVEGVLDRFATLGGLPAGFFQFSAALNADEGLHVSGSDLSTGIPLASAMVVDDLASSGFSWSCPHEWSAREILKMSSPTLTAFAELERYDDGAESWRQVVYGRGSFLRGAKPLGDRELELDGFGAIRLERFDWQPSGRGRTVTSLAHGVSDGLGFWFALDVALDAHDAFATDPSPLLASISVQRRQPQTPSPARTGDE